MLVLSIIAAIMLVIMGAVLFVECKVVEDLPEDNEFKKWWRRHIMDADPEG